MNYKMRKHDSRLIKKGEEYYYINPFKPENIVTRIFVDGGFYYVDSNNFLHNLNGFARIGDFISYFIHGKSYKKEDWLIKREECLLEQHRLDILEEL